MKLAIVTDSTCDLNQARRKELSVYEAPLYVNFGGKVYKDWQEITPKEIIAGITAGEALPKTSQPTPADFEAIYNAAIKVGAEEILCLTVSSGLSGTFQSASLAAKNVNVPVTVYDSRTVSLGLGAMVEKAATMRAEAELPDILSALDHMRDNGVIYFTVGGLEFLQKGGRIGKAKALVGSLLNVKPILQVQEGVVAPLGRARGTKKALKELVRHIKIYADNHEGKLAAYFIHAQGLSNIESLQSTLDESGVVYENRGSYEMGSVVASHAGPDTYGVCLHTEPVI